MDDRILFLRIMVCRSDDGPKSGPKLVTIDIKLCCAWRNHFKIFLK